MAYIINGVICFRYAYNKQTLIHVDDYSMVIIIDLYEGIHLVLIFQKTTFLIGET